MLNLAFIKIKIVKRTSLAGTSFSSRSQEIAFLNQTIFKRNKYYLNNTFAQVERQIDEKLNNILMFILMFHSEPSYHIIKTLNSKLQAFTKLLRQSQTLKKDLY